MYSDTKAPHEENQYYTNHKGAWAVLNDRRTTKKIIITMEELKNEH